MAIAVNDVGLFQERLMKVMSRACKFMVLAPVVMGSAENQKESQKEKEGLRTYIPIEESKKRFPIDRVESEMIVYESDGSAPS